MSAHGKSLGSRSTPDHKTSFPNPASLQIPARGPRSLSMISSGVSEAPGDEESEAVAGATGPVGEPGLPPSRPSTMAQSKASATSRREASSAAEARPPSNFSRTHVPSLTTSAFFRPMSSQRLQAQRNQRPTSNLGSAARPKDGSREGQWTENDPQVEQNVARPVSRATEFTEMPDLANGNASSAYADAGRSGDDSEPPFSDIHSQATHRPPRLDVSSSLKASNATDRQARSPRSPNSFRLSFRNSTQTLSRRPEGHEKLESAPSTPHTIGRQDSRRATRKELGKNYEYFTGNTRFFFGGRAQNARELPINIATGLAMVIPAVLFFIFSAADLWRLVTPAIPIIFAYVFLICLSSFIHASLMNPGILPRNLHPFPPSEPNEDALAIGPSMTEWTMVVTAGAANAAMEVPTKYCKTCNIWRPPRCHHCRQCDNCVETQDHHCVWLNNCVGRRNYRHFFTFIASGSLLALMLIGFSIGHIIAWRNKHSRDGSGRGVSFMHAVRGTRGVPFAMVLYGILIVCYPMALMGYHLFLMGSGQTTREYLQSHKFLKKDRHRPFTQGNVLSNWIATLNRPRPPTYLMFKKSYLEGDQRYGERRMTEKQRRVTKQQRSMEMQSLGHELDH